MTIRPGEPWGTVGPVPPGLMRVDDDLAIRLLVEQATGESPLPVLAPRRGDCWRAAGGHEQRDRVSAGDDVAQLPWDALHVVADDRSLWAVAHVIARGWAYTGEVVAVMNVDHRGAWDVAPRAHPNDGRLDVVHAEPRLPWRARVQARRRLPLGTHVPHPQIRVTQRESAEFTFTTPRRLYVDGRHEGSVRHLRVDVVADRLTLCI